VKNRIAFGLAVAALVWLAGATKDATAAVTISLEWGACGGGAGGCTATGGNLIAVGAGGGQTLRLDVYLRHDLTQGLESHTFSLNFDTALDNELSFTAGMAPVEWAGSDVDPGTGVSSYGPFTAGLTIQESTPSQAGRVNSFESGGLTGVLPANGLAYTVGTSTATAPARYRVGQVFFTAINTPIDDGSDVFSGLFNGLFDLIVDGVSVTVPPGTITFGTAGLYPVAIPEPGTSSLLGLGLLGLVLAARGRRRSKAFIRARAD
jgi:MYXO-CTERM domain-containing protein